MSDKHVLRGSLSEEQQKIFSPGAQTFVAELQGRFGSAINDRLEERIEAAKAYSRGEYPDFPDHTKDIRDDPSWKVASHPSDLRVRHVEITGPASSATMVINAQNSGADGHMVDIEDSDACNRENVLNGQVNLYGAARGNLTAEKKGKVYSIVDPEHAPTLLVRPRGWHMKESHFEVNGQPVSASLFDFGMYFYNNAKHLVSVGKTPAFYLPKMESGKEAQLWASVFEFAEEYVGIPKQSIRATFLAETHPALFQLEEMLFGLRKYCSGANSGRWDKVFSDIKVLGRDPQHIFPDRDDIGMTQPYNVAYNNHIIKTCHKRGAYAMGGMANLIPEKDPDLNAWVMEKVREDKLREVIAGNDGTWVAHPGLVQLAKDVFTEHLGKDNQLEKKLEHVGISTADLREMPTGNLTYDQFKENVRVSIIYTTAWMEGNGCVAIKSNRDAPGRGVRKMEDAATAEISRSQLWQQVKHGVVLDNGERVTADYVRQEITHALDTIAQEYGHNFPAHRGARVVEDIVTAEEIPSFVTTHMYDSVQEKGD